MAARRNILVEWFWKIHPALYRWSGGRIGGTVMNMPVLLLTTVNSLPYVSLGELQRLAARGEVRFVLNHGGCATVSVRPACTPAMRWVRANFRDVTAETGVPPGNEGLLYDLRRPLRG